MRNKLVRRIALLLSVAVMSVSVVACGGGKGDAIDQIRDSLYSLL